MAEMAVFNPFDFFLEPSAEDYPFTYDAALTRELRAFLEIEAAGPELTEWLRKVSRKKVRTIDFLIGTSTSGCQRRHRLRDSHGAGHTDLLTKDGSRCAPDPAAIRPGYWSRSCAIWGLPRDSFPAI